MMDENDEEIEDIEVSQAVPDLDEAADADPADTEYHGDSRRSAPQAERRSPRHIWLISYSDFMTILMIFFLVMYGYTYLAKTALMKAHHVSERDSQFAQMVHKLKTDLGSAAVRVEQSADKATVVLDDKILFDSGRAELGGTAKGTLEDIAKSVMLLKGPVIVEGHTDDVPIKTLRYKSNWELSAARAFAVIEALTAAGVPAERLSAWGFGENRPVAPNDSVKNRAQNRRINIIILRDEKRMG